MLPQEIKGMTRNEAFRCVGNIVNTQLLPALRGDRIDSKHRAYIEDMIQQLYRLSKTALRDRNNDRYRIKYECDSYGMGILTIEDGFVGCAIEPEYYIYFLISGEVSTPLDINKVKSPFLRRRIRDSYPTLRIIKAVIKSGADFCDSFEPYQYEELYTTPISISFKAQRNFFAKKEEVFEYRKGLPFFDYCTFEEYIKQS